MVADKLERVLRHLGESQELLQDLVEEVDGEGIFGIELTIALGQLQNVFDSVEDLRDE